jgi:hypothetical protein
MEILLNFCLLLSKMYMPGQLDVEADNRAAGAVVGAC